MSMNILILNGSPSAHGRSMALAELVTKGLSRTSKAIHLYRKRISPCLGCGACAKGGACPIPDFMPALMKLLAEADFILVASPLHFTSLTAPVIAFFSRLQPAWHARKSGRSLLVPPRKRLACLVVTGGDEYPDMFHPARSTAVAAFNSLGLEFVGMVTACNTDSLPVEKNSRSRGEAEELRNAVKKALLQWEVDS